MLRDPQHPRGNAGSPAPSRTFTMGDQKEFADFSGDHNPLHLDAEYARRTWAGAPVVHGINILLWTIEEHLRSQVCSPTWRTIRADFRAPLLVDERCDMRSHDKSGGTVAQVLVGDTVHSSIQLRDRGLRERIMRDSLPGDPVIDATAPRSPAALTPLDVTLQRGRIHAGPSTGALSYPNTLAVIGSQRMQAMGMISMLVGMVCPGLHSVRSAVVLDINGPDVSWLDYEILEPVAGSQQVICEVSGLGIRGWVEAMFRPSPVAQAPADELAQLVAAREFADCTALVVGGSRGLGALTAKILAVGRAPVLLTYAIGKRDAEAIQQEIREAGGLCEIMKFNVLEDALTLPVGHPWPTHAYYFATPIIHATRRQTEFDGRLFDRFQSYYVDGLAKIARALAVGREETIRIFNPVAGHVIETQADGAEYLMAKSAGETKSVALEREHANLQITACRLPPMLTDQTARIVPVAMDPAVAVMLPLIRQFQGLGSTSPRSTAPPVCNPTDALAK